MTNSRLTMSIKCEHCGSAIRAFKARKDFENRKLHLKCWKIEQDMIMLRYEMNQLKREEERRKREEEERDIRHQQQVEESRRIWNSKTPEERKVLNDKWDADEAKFNLMSDYEREKYFSRFN